MRVLGLIGLLTTAWHKFGVTAFAPRPICSMKTNLLQQPSEMKSTRLHLWNTQSTDSTTPSSRSSTSTPSSDAPAFLSTNFLAGVLDKTRDNMIQKTSPSNDVTSDYNEQSSSLELDPRTSLPLALGLVVALGTAGASAAGIQLQDVLDFAQHLLSSPKETLEQVVDFVAALGPLGAVYFGLIYLVAEILAVPATPLTLSAGYLFGLTQGTAIVLLSATLAASVAFYVGKTFLRSWVEDVIEENETFRKLDRAIGKEGFRLLLLVRLSPIFPFALSNYLYGASSINFAAYFWGTILGFAPGTLAYVYTGMVGKALTMGGGDAQPWYVYGGGFLVLGGMLKLVADVASDIIGALDEDDVGEQDDTTGGFGGGGFNFL